MKKIRSCLALILVLIMACTVFTGCENANANANANANTKSSDGSAAPSATSADGAAAVASNVKNPDTMVIVSENEPTSLDPHIAYDNMSTHAISQVYEGLVCYAPGTNEVAPELAEKWDVDDEGLVWTFYLRQGIKFTDGTDFNAEAAKYNIERELTINQGPAWMFEMIESVEVIDDYTIRITLEYPYVPFLQALACGPRIKFASPTAIKEHEVNGDLAKDWLKENMVGTGPYMLENWTIGQGYTMVKNENYWGGWEGKHVSKIEFKVIKESSSQLLMLESGDADFATGITTDSMSQLQSNPDVEVLNNPTINTLHLYFNNQRGELANKLVRQAMAYGFSYEDTINGIFNGSPRRLVGPMADDVWGHDDDLAGYTTDIEKAKELLADAGYPGGGLKFTCYVETGADDYAKVAELFQSDMKKIGIEIEIQRLAWATIREMLDTAETAPDMFISGFYPDYMDPDGVLYIQYHSSEIGNVNQSFYINEDVDSLLEQARKITDSEKRAAMYKEIQQTINDDCPVIFVMTKGSYTTKRSWVQGYVYTPTMEKTYYSMYKE